MSRRPMIPLHFACNYDYLKLKGIEKIAFLLRDQAELEDRGITLAKIEELEALRLAFNDIPSNVTEVHDSSKGFNDRDSKANELRIAFRDVLGIAKNTFGIKSSIYKSFGIKELSALTPNKLYNKTGNVVFRGTKNMAAMGPKGLKPIMLTNITTLSEELLVLIAATPILVSSATLLTGTRRETANAFFDMLRDMCETAKNYYYERNRTKYNDYVVYDIAAKLVDRRGKLVAHSFKAPKTKGVKDTTRFRIRTTMGKSLQYYFSLLKGDAPPADALTVLPNPNIFVKKTAAQLGYNATTGMIQLNVYNPNEETCAFFIKMG